MAVELITVTTRDGVELDGALYLPRVPSAAGARILMVHGLTWNFYRGPSRWLPPLLAEAGHTCLSLNMRDHDLSEPKDFALSHHDLRAGVEYLRELGAAPVVVLAHGYACNKAVCYPAWSGDAGVRHHVLTTLGAVQRYRPDIWETVLRKAPELAGRVLVVQGAVDPLIDARERAGELAAAAGRARVDVTLLEGANHYFDGRRRELAACITGWLDGALAGERGA
jgi:alpha-beta hydrolase superfamily lysophospholipase